MKIIKFLVITFSLFIYVVSGQVCVRDGQYCGSTDNMCETPCCDGLKCVMDARPIDLGCREECCPPIIYKCLDCINETNGLCGGPNDIKCCPLYGCARNNSCTNSFGKCLPKP